MCLGLRGNVRTGSNPGVGTKPEAAAAGKGQVPQAAQSSRSSCILVGPAGIRAEGWEPVRQSHGAAGGIEIYFPYLFGGLLFSLV